MGTGEADVGSGATGRPVRMLVKNTPCTAPGCSRQQHGSGLCRKHYSKKWYAANAARPRAEFNKDKTCTTEGCGRPVCARGLCRPCYKADWVRERKRRALRAKARREALIQSSNGVSLHAYPVFTQED